MRVDGNYGSTLGYEPNSYGEWMEDPTRKDPPLRITGNAIEKTGPHDISEPGADVYNYPEREYDSDYYSQPGALFRLMTPEEQQLLFENTARARAGCEKFIKERHVRNCFLADPAYGEGVAKALGL